MEFPLGLTPQPKRIPQILLPSRMLELLRIRKSEYEGDTSSLTRRKRETQLRGSDSDLASTLNSATGKRIRPTATNFRVNLVERRQRRSKGRRRC